MPKRSSTTLALRDAARVDDPRRVPRAALEPLDPARQRNLLRHLLRRGGLRAAERPRRSKSSAPRCSARGRDAQPLMRWAGGEARVFRDAPLFACAALPSASPRGFRGAARHARGRWSGPEGELEFEPRGAGPGLPESWLDDGLTLRFRAGGEGFKPLGPSATAARSSTGCRKPRSCPGCALAFRFSIAPPLVAVGDLWLAAERVPRRDRAALARRLDRPSAAHLGKRGHSAFAGAFR